MLFLIKKRLLNQQLSLYGKKQQTSTVNSIVMEYADNGDLFQKICDA